MARVLRPGYSLSEVILSLGLAAVAVLTTVELGISALRANQKGSDLMLAGALASQGTEEMVYSLPPLSDSFWSTSQTFAYQSSTVFLGSTPFQRDIFLQDLGGAQKGLKLVLVNVSWGSGSVGGTSGYGQQTVQATRMIYGH